MDILSIFLSYQFITMSLAISIIIYIIRTIVGYKVDIESIKIVRDVVLPIAPMVIGAVFGLIARNFPYPELINGSLSGRACFGLIAGLFSAQIYKIIKAQLAKME